VNDQHIFGLAFLADRDGLNLKHGQEHCDATTATKASGHGISFQQ
jgi:hypothetical protein